MVVCRPLERESASLVVGQNEDSGSPVRGPDIGRSKHTPFRIEPKIGQVTEDDAEPASADEGRHVFQPDEAGIHFANAVSDVGPDPPLVVHALAFAGCGPGLTREARNDAIHESTPASAVEGDNVVPDRRRIQPPVCHARHQYSGGIGFPLNVQDGAVGGEDKPQSEFEPRDAGT